MKKLLKKILTDKLARKATVMSAFVLTVVSTGTATPWGS